jgi:hypothetical protein
MHYKGSWLNDQRHGQGLLTLPDGSFEGMWANGKMNGEGSLVLEKEGVRAVVTGEWTDDQISKGTIRYYANAGSELLG